MGSKPSSSSNHCRGRSTPFERPDGPCGDVLVDEYYELKRENQYTQEQIQAKRKSLEGVLVPITESWNIDLLRSAGFKKIDCFWRYLNFAGYLAVKK